MLYHTQPHPPASSFADPNFVHVSLQSPLINTPSNRFSSKAP